jgi:hypothetical protein
MSHPGSEGIALGGRRQAAALMVGLPANAITISLVGVTMTLEPSPWYAGSMLLLFAIVSAIAGYSFWVSLGGNPLFVDGALEP